MKIKLGVLIGGDSSERDISIETAKEVLKNLDKNKYEIQEIMIDENNHNQWIRSLLDTPPDVVLSALHGGKGENGSVQGLLECMNIKYVGSGVLASALGMDKQISKMMMSINHIPIATDLFIKKEESIILYEEKINELGFPLVVKPNNGGSSIGVSIVNNFDALITAFEFIKNIPDDILIEKYISGREVTCGVVETENGIEVLTVLDISTEKTFYDYAAKYSDETTKIDFSTLPEFLQVMIQEIAKKVFCIFNCKGYARVDMIVHEEQVYVLEINTLPGLTSHSLIPKAATGKGMDFSQFLDLIIQQEMNRTKI